MTLPYRAALQGIPAYEAGKSPETLLRERGIAGACKLASNENPLGPGRAAARAFGDSSAQLHRYPDASHWQLRQSLAGALQLPMQQLVVGNGSNELFELLTRLFVDPGDEVVYSQYAFVAFAVVTRLAGGNPVVVPEPHWHVDLQAMAAAVTSRTRLIFLANPNNPTGTLLPADEVRQFLDRVPSRVVVVLDEAYREYVRLPDYPESLPWLREYPNLVITRTFSKIHGLAGLRVGYAMASADICSHLERVREPFNVNLPALAAASAAITDHEHVARSQALNAAGIQRLQALFADLELVSLPSQGNFVTVDCARPAAPVYAGLLSRGVIVRPLLPYDMPNHLRVSTGTSEQMDRFAEVFTEVLAC